jgi:hypothetical protein
MAGGMEGGWDKFRTIGVRRGVLRDEFCVGVRRECLALAVPCSVERGWGVVCVALMGERGLRAEDVGCGRVGC